MYLTVGGLLILFSVSEAAKKSPAKEEKKALSTQDYECPCGCWISNDGGATLQMKENLDCSNSKSKLENIIINCPCGCRGTLPSGNTFKIANREKLCKHSEVAYVDTSSNSCSCGCTNQKSANGVTYSLNGNERCGLVDGYLFPTQPPATPAPAISFKDPAGLNDFFTML